MFLAHSPSNHLGVKEFERVPNVCDEPPGGPRSGFSVGSIALLAGNNSLLALKAMGFRFVD